MQKNHTKTGFYVPVLREDPPEHPPSDAPLMDTESTFNFWLVVILAIAALGSIGLMWGWFKTPEQSLIEKNAKLQQSLIDQKNKKVQLNQCFKEFNK